MYSRLAWNLSTKNVVPHKQIDKKWMNMVKVYAALSTVNANDMT